MAADRVRVVRVVAVDWSGRASLEHRHLWMAEIDDGEPVRLAGASRAEAVDRLLSLAASDPELIVGLDFSFSFPAWFMRRQRFGSAIDAWSAASLLNEWLATCPHPFWGRPGHPCPRDVELLRITERLLKPRPKSIFQIGGAGSVGTGSLRGMPALLRLRQAGFAIWPFDTPRLPLVVEMWPRLLTNPSVVKSRQTARAGHPQVPPAWQLEAEMSEDAFDAATAAVGMYERLDDLQALPAVPAGDEIALEGWVWRAPLPAHRGNSAALCSHRPGIGRSDGE
jgi:hypothetical protein